MAIHNKPFGDQPSQFDLSYTTEKALPVQAAPVLPTFSQGTVLRAPASLRAINSIVQHDG